MKGKKAHVAEHVRPIERPSIYGIAIVNCETVA